MKYDQNISNGRPCISAEWIHELNIWEHELAYTDDCLPLVPGDQIVSLAMVGAAASQTITASHDFPAEAGSLATSIKTAVLA